MPLVKLCDDTSTGGRRDGTRDGGTMAAGRIVVGVDGSAGSERALRWCAEYGLRLGFEVIAVFSMPLPAYAAVVPFGPWPVDDTEMRARLLETLHDDWCAPLREAGVKFDVLLVDGAAAWMLIDVAEREDADLIVVGSRGRGGFSELLLGSTSHQLAQHARRPLLIVPPGRD
jgi:nucleotide-binding universal stress UspA family protein